MGGYVAAAFPIILLFTFLWFSGAHEASEPPHYKYSAELNKPGIPLHHEHDHPNHVHGHGHGHEHKHERVHTQMNAERPTTHGEISHREIWLYTIGSVLVISVIPLIALLILPDLNKHPNLLKVLLGFAAGGLLGDAFLHLIPHAVSFHGKDAEQAAYIHDQHGHSHLSEDTAIPLWVIGGIFAFLCVDKFLRFISPTGHTHAHNTTPQQVGDAKKKKKNGSEKESKKDKTQNIQATGYLNLAADFTHNFTDGIAIAGSFLINRNIGFVTTLTVLVHELPHEIGDYAILVKSGCGAYRAMLLQLVTALGALFGASLSLVIAGIGVDAGAILGFGSGLISTEIVATRLLPVTAGGFIYIAMVSVMPDLLEGTTSAASTSSIRSLPMRLLQSVFEIGALVLGVLLMAAITLFE